MLKALMDNPYIWLILSVCTVASLFVQKTKRQVSYTDASYEIVKAGKSTVPELQLTYKKAEIENLVITRYTLWNSGNVELRSEDIVQTKPLSIRSANKGTKFLDVQIICTTDEDNGFSVEQKQRDCIEVHFNHMNKMDGVVVQILHTGCASDIKVQGKLIGGKPLKAVPQENELDSLLSSNKMLFRILVFLMISFMVATVFSLLLTAGIIPSAVIQYFPLIPAELLYALAILSLFGAFICMARAFVEIYRLRIPSKLRNSASPEEDAE